METKTDEPNTPAAAETVTESLLDRAVKADKFFTKVDPDARNMAPEIAIVFLGGLSFIDACPDGTVRKVARDRVALGLEGLTLKNNIDGIFVRSTPKANLVHLFFVEGMNNAKAKAKELFAKHGSNILVAVAQLYKEEKDATTRPHLKDCPPHLNMGGFRVVSAAYGVTLYEMLDVVRAHTGIEIKTDPEWEEQRVEYVAHTKTCDCENCVATYKDQAALHEHFYGVSGVLVTEASSATAKAPTVAFTSEELEAAKARSTVHEAPATVN
jgi:hypothetical protein